MKSLTKYFNPKNYKLSLNLNPDRLNFEGTVIIIGKPLGDVAHFHIGKELEIVEVASDTDDSPKWEIVDEEKSLSRRREIIVYTQAKWISIKFKHPKIETSSMSGLYAPVYKVDDETHHMFSTQFEPNYAADCFPCIDEPAAKATFDIDVALTPEYDNWTVISNMPEKKHIGSHRYFETTPKMSTYLVAIVAGELISRSAKTESGVKVSAYATPAQDSDELAFPLETAVHAIEFYEDYFGIPYPLPKLDNVAIPDFSAGAMENWGLITYRESMFLADETSSIDTRQTSVSTVAHEIAHQWFGDLVTMQWWNDLWLNESFASLMEDLAGDSLHPEYHVWESFAATDAFSAMYRDSASDVQAVQQEVDDPREIPLLFDSAIVYAKGKRLLKMLMRYVGKNVFRNGIKQYLESHKYGNTTADDLWQALSDASGEDIKALMTPWLTQPGYPVVTIKRELGKISLTQRRVRSDSKNDNTTWPIPLFLSGSKTPRLMTERTIEIKSAGNLQLNMGGDSYFIADYGPAEQMTTPDISEQKPLDQIKLINDSLLLSETYGGVYFNDAINYVQYIMFIKNPAVLIAAERVASFARSMLADDMDPNYRRLIGIVHYPLYYDYFIADHHQDLTVADRQIVPTVISRELYAGNEAVVKSMTSMGISDDVVKLNADLRPLAMSAAVQYGDGSPFKRLWDIYLITNDADLREDIAAALSRSRKADEIEYNLTQIRSGAVRTQDKWSFIYYLMSNTVARPKAWQWLQDNWNWIEQTYYGDMSFDDFIRIAGATLSTPKELKEFDKLFGELAKRIPATERTVNIAREQITRRIELIRSCRSIVDDFTDMILYNRSIWSDGIGPFISEFSDDIDMSWFKDKR